MAINAKSNLPDFGRLTHDGAKSHAHPVVRHRILRVCNAPVVEFDVGFADAGAFYPVAGMVEDDEDELGGEAEGVEGAADGADVLALREEGVVWGGFARGWVMVCARCCGHCFSVA